ncbi:phage portal protein [Streptomyces zhihengii]
MPLPTTDTMWPPIDPKVSATLADWDAWWSAEPDRLEQRYMNRAAADQVNRPSQLRGGVVGAFARWFWGAPTPAGEKRTKLHVPLAGDIARTSSELLFSEPPRITSPATATQDRLDALVEGGLHATLLEGGEVGSALGGAYLRVVWDADVSDTPWIDAVAADRAVPEFRYGRLHAVTFWTVLGNTDTDDRRVFRHLEKHERGRIYHGLYEGSLTSLGHAVPLTEHPDTAGLAREVDSEGGLDTGAPKHLTASYAPNVRPSRAWRHIPTAARWGQSDFQGIEGILDALDETYSSWMRDVQNGKGRILLSEAMLQSAGPGKGGVWNEDQRVYTGLSRLPRVGEADPIDVVQFEIRVQEHADTCRALIEQAVRQAGYSASTFGESGDGAAVTATEIRARERRSMSTRARKALYWGPAIADIVAALLAVESGERFGVRDLDTNEPPRVEFEDSISEGPKELAETAEVLRRAEAASTETLVRLVNPSMDAEAVKAEVARINSERDPGAPDPTERHPL